jgi:hypothetical protein
VIRSRVSTAPAAGRSSPHKFPMTWPQTLSPFLSMGNYLSMGSRLISNTTRPGSRLLNAAQTPVVRVQCCDTVRLRSFSARHENAAQFVLNGELAFCNGFLSAKVWPGKYRKEGSWKERGTITRAGIRAVIRSFGRSPS